MTKIDPKVIHCRSKPPPQGEVVYIGRPSKWGNPFAIDADWTREQVIEKYEAYIKSRPDLLAALPELAGKHLACWCAPRTCHGDVLLKLANPKQEK